MNKNFIEWLSEQEYSISVRKSSVINLTWEVNKHGMWNWKDVIDDATTLF
jgi:hypothetical protein